MSESQRTQTSVCFFRHFCGNKLQVQKVMLVGCDWWISIRLVCFKHVERWMSKGINTMHVTLNAAVKFKLNMIMHYELSCFNRRIFSKTS